jgi:glycosyltransferase involved in cell wall biosynthesis
MKESAVTVVMPAYNEEGAVGEVVAALLALSADLEILVVDDGSTDGTAARAAEAGATVIAHDRNRGYGAALKTGVQRATRDYVLFCDSDGQHRVEDVARLIEECDDYDMVVGERTGDSHQDWIRKPGKWVLRVVANGLAGQKIPDLNSGLRIFKRDTLRRYLHLMPNGFSFSTTSTLAMMKSGRRVRYLPITALKRVGQSTVSQLRHGPATLLLILRLTVLFEPLKIFLTVAAGLFLLSLLSLGVDVAFGNRGIGDTTVLLSLSSLLVFMFGLLCDQVSAIRREKHE